MCNIPSAISVTTYAELRAEGWSRRGIESGLSTGSLTRLRRGVYARADACEDVIAAAQHGGPLACVSAARHLGLWVLTPEVPPHVWMRHGHRHDHEFYEQNTISSVCGCIEHWDEGPFRDSFGLPSAPRILLQIFRCQSAEVFFATLESARRQKRITRSGLRWLRARVGAAGRPLIDFSRANADSGLESLLRWRLRAYNLDVRSQVFVTGVGHVDFLIGGMLIIEVDGQLGHADSASRHKDLVRDAQAALWDLHTLRFDYAMVIHDWELVEGAILQRAAHLGLLAG